MKKAIFLTVVFLSAGMWNSYCQKSGEPEGVWKMTYQRFETPDKIIERNPEFMLEIFVSLGDTLYDPVGFKNPSYKIFNDNHFSLSGMDEENQFRGHFGKYSYDGETYSEHIKYSTYEHLIGQSVKMKSRMDGDNWTIEGVIPIEFELRIFSRFRDLKFTETWQRVK
jgi:hypothetical protein